VKGILFTLAAIMMSSAAVAQLPVYTANFDSAPYVVDDTLNNKDGWTVTGPTGAAATVRAGTAQKPAVGNAGNYVELVNGVQIDKTFSGDVNGIVWVEGYFRGEGSDATLETATYPSGTASAIVHFSKTAGIQVLNGNRQDGGTPESANVPLGAANANNWHKITIRLNFNPVASGGQVWDLWVNNELKKQNLGFKSANVTKLSGFKNLAQTSADFDNFRVVRPLSGDANGDSVVDAADVTAIVQNLPILANDIIVRSNVDTDGDGTVGAAELNAVVSKLINQS